MANGLFLRCDKLIFADLGLLGSLGQYTFYGQANLKTVVLRNPNGAAMSTTSAFYSMDTTGTTVYVPKALIDSGFYETATNWTTFAGQFRAIEDYELDSISISVSELTFTSAEPKTLTATTVPAGRDVEWYSSNRMVAKVENGVVTPVSDGTAIITATGLLGESASCMVTVNAGLTRNLLNDVAFNVGYLNNNGGIGSTTSANDTYTDKFDISEIAGINIVVTLLDVKSGQSNSRICFYNESNGFISCVTGTASGSNAVMSSTVPINAKYAAISINKSSGFSGIEITCDGSVIGAVDY